MLTRLAMRQFYRYLLLASALLAGWSTCWAQPVNALDSAIRTKLFSQPDSARMLIETQQALSEQMPVLDVIHYSVARNWGGHYWIAGKLDTALSYFNEALRVAETLGQPELMAGAQTNLGIIYIDLEDWQRAMQYERAALELSRSIGDEPSMTYCYLNLGLVYKELQAYDTAMLLLDSAAMFAEAHNAQGQLALVHSSLADVFIATGNAVQARDHALKSIAIARGLAHTKTVVHAQIHLSRAALMLQQPDSATAIAKQALGLSHGLQFQEGIYLAYYNLYLIAQAEGDAVTSIAAFEQYIQARDSIFSKEILTEIRNLELKELEREKDTEHASSTASLRNNIIGLSGLLLGLLAAVLIFRYRMRTAQQRAQTLLQERTNAESQVHSEQEARAALQEQLELNEKELLQYALTNERQSELLKMVEAELRNAPAEVDSQVLNDLNRLLKSKRVLETDWQEFEARFNQVNDGFYQRLTKQAPKLSASELRLSAFLKMNLSSKQIAYLLRIEPSSVDVARYRLRKKLKLGKEENLSAFLNAL